jgi:hypothetical protein
MEARAHPARGYAAQLAWLGKGQALATAGTKGRPGHGSAVRRARGGARSRADAGARADARARADACPRAGPRRRPCLPNRSAGISCRWTAGRSEPWARPRQRPRQPRRTRSQITRLEPIARNRAVSMRKSARLKQWNPLEFLGAAPFCDRGHRDRFLRIRGDRFEYHDAAAMPAAFLRVCPGGCCDFD